MSPHCGIDFIQVLPRRNSTIEPFLFERLAFRVRCLYWLRFGGYICGQQSFVFVLIQFTHQWLDVALQIALAISDNSLVLPFRRHDFIIRWKRVVPFQLRQQECREFPGIGDHCQEMTAIQRGGVVVANPAVGRQQEGIG